jgi:hypothetical protein
MDTKFNQKEHQTKTKSVIEIQENKNDTIGQNYDVWDYFAEFLRNEYKFNVIVTVCEEYVKRDLIKYSKKDIPNNGEYECAESDINYNTIIKFKKVLIVKALHDNFSIRIENVSKNMIKMYYCYHNEALVLKYDLMFCSKIINEIINQNEIVKHVLYGSNDFIDDDTLYIQDDKIINELFSENDLIDEFVANKIIKHLHFYLSVKGFFRFVVICGYEMTQQIYYDERMEELCSDKTNDNFYSKTLFSALYCELRESNDDHEYYLQMYNGILETYLYKNKFIEELSLAAYEHNEILHCYCSAYIQCRDILYEIITGDTILPKSLRILVIDYLIGTSSSSARSSGI